ncbi:hypothetical protein LZC95_47800 [Pendulispora brunnea]|uniref:Uncharacterized protein n=1 Tax=Pendulispora brunnea TaxID=2905690 RepID=A0ABZ2K612_9BACT
MTTLPYREDSQLRFPAFMWRPDRRAARLLGEMTLFLAKRYARTGSFVDPQQEMIADSEWLAVAPESPVIVHEAVDLLASGYPGYRLYLVRSLRIAVQEALDWQERDQVEDAFAAAVGNTCWGAVALTVADPAPRYNLGALKARISVVLRHWNALAELRYIDVGPLPSEVSLGEPGAPLSLEELMNERHAGLTALWLPGDPTGDPRQDIPAAVDALEAADPETREARALTWLAALAAEDPDLRHPEAMSDMDFLRQEWTELTDHERDAIAAGSTSLARAILRRADRYFEPLRH